MSARDIIKRAFETEFDDTYSGDAFADKCVTILHEEGYRILAPGEMTPEEDAFEKVAQWHDKNARYCLEASKDEPRLNEDDRRRAREAAKHHAASAAAIRNKMAGERRSAIRALEGRS